MAMLSALRAMSEPEYAAWLAQVVPFYAAGKAASGEWTQADALARSAQEYAQLLPQGLATPDNYLYTIVDAQAQAVGSLWFAAKTKFNARIAFVFDVGVLPHRQREGHAERALRALEDELRRLGLSGMALHVFGHDVAAQALYAKLGFQATNISLFKPIGAASAG
jgi:ribosomal protein S18 acetylase RimI-like enzyme